MLCHFLSVVSLVLFVVFPLSTLASSNALPQTSREDAKQQQEPLKTCIDDSDCSKVGNEYRCFLYLCYPWRDDNKVSPSEKRRTCRGDPECDPGQTCVRHYDKRRVTRGLCFDEVKNCNSPKDCAHMNMGCCGQKCCEQKYYSQFANLPCVSDFGCEDLGLGKFCCPHNGTNICCDTNPNPEPTQSPSVGDSASAAQTSTVTQLILTLVTAVTMMKLVQ